MYLCDHSRPRNAVRCFSRRGRRLRLLSRRLVVKSVSIALIGRLLARLLHLLAPGTGFHPLHPLLESPSWYLESRFVVKNLVFTNLGFLGVPHTLEGGVKDASLKEVRNFTSRVFHLRQTCRILGNTLLAQFFFAYLSDLFNRSCMLSTRYPPTVDPALSIKTHVYQSTRFGHPRLLHVIQTCSSLGRSQSIFKLRYLLSEASMTVSF